MGLGSCKSSQAIKTFLVSVYFLLFIFITFLVGGGETNVGNHQFFHCIIQNELNKKHDLEVLALDLNQVSWLILYMLQQTCQVNDAKQAGI